MLLLKASRIVNSMYPTCGASTLIHQHGISQCSSELAISAGLLSTCSRLATFTRTRVPSAFVLRGSVQMDTHGVVYHRLVSGLLVRQRCAGPFVTHLMVSGSNVHARGTDHTLFRKHIALSSFGPVPGGPVVTKFFARVNHTSSLNDKAQGVCQCSHLCSNGRPILRSNSIFGTFIPIPGKTSKVKRARDILDHEIRMSITRDISAISRAVTELLTRRKAMSDTRITRRTRIAIHATLHRLAGLAQSKLVYTRKRGHGEECQLT